MTNRGSKKKRPAAAGAPSPLSAARDRMTLEVKRLLGRRRLRCSPRCPGWFINVDTGHPERCDECADDNGYANDLADIDLYVLPAVTDAMVAWRTAEPDQRVLHLEANRLRHQTHR
jgi:hypothetical protein